MESVNGQYIMKINKRTKEYKVPQFQLVMQNGPDKVFFVASGPAAPSVGGSLGTMGSTNGAW